MSKKDREDKLSKVLDATEHPEQYTDEQLEELLSDEECADYYRLMCDAASAYAATHTETDEELEAEWQRLQHRGARPVLFSIRKIAAVVIAILALTGISYAAVSLMTDHEGTPSANTEMTETPSLLPDSPTEPADTVQTFQNVELQDILTAVATHYQLQTEYRNEQSRHVRLYIKWNKSEGVETMLERLNKFDKVTLTLSDNKIIVE
jgi:hypothetical protein